MHHYLESGHGMEEEIVIYSNEDLGWEWGRLGVNGRDWFWIAKKQKNKTTCRADINLRYARYST
jgi:hypothetical protein